MMKKTLLLCLVAGLGLRPVVAQTDSTTAQDLLRLKVKDMYQQITIDLLNVEVTLASKRAESLLAAPISISVLTREEIKHAGCNSLAEAFRLIPGMLVYEQTNGNFDLQVRGGGNLPRNTLFSISANTTTLVMIDNRPIYNYYLGGTFWETLPIDLNDVERIEIVCGPASAMYGPNAVSGVINIITRKPEEQGLYAVVNAAQGSNNTFINNASIGYRWGKKLYGIISGNFQSRNRTQNTYYNYPQDKYVPLAELVQPSPLGDAYTNPELAQRKYGTNAFVYYEPNDRTSFRLSTGYQSSQVQKAYSENFATPLTTALSNSWYADVQAKVNNFVAQVSLQNGTQEEGLGTLGQKWDFRTLDALIEYEARIKNLILRPGVNYRQAVYDDTPYVDVALKTGQFNGSRDITTIAPYLRADYNVRGKDRFRLVGAVRIDQFNFPDKPYFSYQFATVYRPNPRHSWRVVHSRANQSANIIFTYADRYLSNLFGPGLDLEVAGNRDLNLLTTDTWGAGYRGKLLNNLLMEIEAVYNYTRNYANFIYGDTRTVGARQIQPFQTLNLPLQAHQYLVSVSMNYILQHLQFRPFITLQHTRLQNATAFTNTAGALFSGNPDPTRDNINSGIGNTETHTGVPTWYGGFYLNYRYKQWNLNLNPYLFGAYEFYSFQNPNYADGRGRARIPAKLLINAKVVYAPTGSLNVYLNLRNLLDNRSAEFFRTDAIGLSLFGGIHFDF